MFLYYFRSIGWEAEEVHYEEWESLRRALRRTVARAVRGVPRTPLPHGKISGHLFDFFPDELQVDESQWWQRLAKKPAWFAIPEEPETAVFLVRPKRRVDELPPTDLFFFSSDESSEILATDHERFGPWIIETDKPVKAIRRLEPRGFLGAGLLPREEISRTELAEAVTWTKRRLRKKRVYIPRYRLRTTGVAADNLWNYLPEAFDASIDPGSFAREAFRRSGSVLAWSEATGEFGVLHPHDDDRVQRVPDCYYLDWPRRRWLLAVPRLFVENPQDSWVAPSFIVF